MIRAAGLALAGLAAVASPAAAEDSLAWPGAAFLRDTRSDTALDVRCEPPEGDRLTCRFTEIAVSRNAPSDPPDVSASLCRELDAFIAAERDGVAPPGADAEVFRDRFARRSDAEAAEIERLTAALADYCKAPNDQAADRLAALLGERARRTCIVAIKPYRLDFDWDPETLRWESVSVPADDECGTITAGIFEPAATGAANPSWNYRIELRPSRAGGTCPETDETTHLYASEPADLYADCAYLRFRN